MYVGHERTTYETTIKNREYVLVPSSAGGNSSLEQHPRSTEELGILGRYHHFNGHSGMCA
jgi:hypothetical protein